MSGRVYLSYDQGDPAGTGFGMLEEWRTSPVSQPTQISRVATLVDGAAMSPQLQQTGDTHGIDSVVVGPDDTVWLSVGDDAATRGDPKQLRAQDLDQPYGKLLHLTPQGTGVPSNPFFVPAAPRTWRSMIYASGFRNPFRFSLDGRTGRPVVGDVGWVVTEEVNVVPAGFNGGWPCYEGVTKTTRSSSDVCSALYAAGTAPPPLWMYPHSGVGAAVVGGILYAGSSYPDLYHHSLFFGDYAREQIWTMAIDPSGRVARTPEAVGFASDAGGPVAFHAGPNGDVTYADLLAGKIRRIVYRPGNRKPVAEILATTNAPTRTVNFSGAGTYDLDHDQLSYSWSFGDGQSAAGPQVGHAYRSGDPVEVTLVVRDQLGASDTARTVVHPANNSPVLTMAVAPERSYAVGDTVALRARAVDAEDGDLAVTWGTALLHCPYEGSCHRHPDDTRAGASYVEAFTDHGADTVMVVTASATDGAGATTTQSYAARPALRTLAVNSPVPVSVNGITTASAQVVVGSSVQLDAPVVASYRRFVGWSDGGNAAHSFVMPAQDQTLSARYRTEIDRYHAALGGSASFLGPATSSEYDVVGGRAKNFTGGRVYWSADSGAHEVHGRILEKFLADGGPSVFGFPTSDELAVTGGRASTFTLANIYYSRASGAHFSRGKLLSKYLASGGPGAYGLPTSDDTSVKGGYYANFTRGRAIWYSSATGAHLVYGRILERYASVGYAKSCLGFPTTDEYQVSTARRNKFTGGRITYYPETRSTVLQC